MGIVYEIREYSSSDNAEFEEMLGECFGRDYNIELSNTQLSDLCREIICQADAGVVFIDLLIIGGTPKGFIIYQIDSQDSDWCEREGWGFIRELFVMPEFRRKGYGRQLSGHAEKKLLALAVPGIYLTTDDRKDFWTDAGFYNTGEICLRNDGTVFTKKYY